MVTYNSLLQDDDFLSDAYHSLRGMGYEVTNDREQVLKKFLQTRRYFDTNLASTITQGDNIKDLSDADKKSLRNALDKVDKLPSIFSKGSAPKWNALKDYTFAGVSDPTNLLSIIAGAFTLGTGTAIGFGAKEAAKQGVKAALKSKANALVSKPVLKALAAEGTIAGVGGATQSKLSQDTDMEIGRRAKGDYDVGQIALQGLLEGVGSPLFGAGLNLTGTLAKEGVRDLGKVTGINDSQFVTNTQHFLEKWFSPAAGIDKASLREIEMGEADFRDIKQKAEDIAEDIDSAFKINFKDPNETFKIKREVVEKESEFADFSSDDPFGLDVEPKVKTETETLNPIDLVNAAMEGDSAALDILKVRSPEMFDVMERFDGLRKNVYQRINEVELYTSKKLQNIYKKNPTYVRDVFDKFTNTSREPFSDFVNKNKGFLNEFEKFVFSDSQIEYAQRLGLRDADGKFKPIDRSVKNKILLNEAKNLYDPTKRKNSKYGALTKKTEVPEVIKLIYGKNVNPAIRATQTIAGIVEPISDLRIASGLKSSLERRNIGTMADNSVEAALKTGTDEDMVPLISNKSDINKEQRIDAPFEIRGDIYDPDLEKFYIPKSVAEKIKAMTDRTGYLSKNELLGPLAQAFAASQGYLKKGKTVYSPFAHIRNFLGAMQNVANSGNWGGIGSFAKKIQTASADDKKAFFNNMRRMGISGTNVELNQILNRLTDLGDISEDNLKGLSGWASRNLVRTTSLGVSSLEKTKHGRRVSRKLEKLYTQTDDVGKMMAFLGERTKAQRMFDEMSDAQKNAFRTKYRNTFDRDPATPTEKEAERMLRVAEVDITKEFIDGQKVRKFSPKKVSATKAKYEKLLKEFDSKMLDEFATQKALDVMPVYSRIPRVLEKMRGIPVIGSFTAFPAENLRNKYNVLKLGAQEIRDGFELGNGSLIRTGANRLLSQGAIASAPIIAAYAYNEANGTDKVMPFVRESFPEWSKYHALQIRKRKNKQGEDEYAVTDLSYNNPDQFVLDIISPLMVSAANGEDVTANLDELFKDVIIGTAEPFVDKSLALQYAQEMLGFIRADNPEIAADKLTRAYKISEPGLIKNLREIAGDLGAYQAIDKFSDVMGVEATPGSYLQSKLEPLYYGDKRRTISDAASVSAYLAEAGLVGDNFLIPFTPASRETILNPQKQLGFAVKTLMRNANSDFNIASKTIKNRLKDTTANFTLKGMLDLYKDAIEEQFAAQQGINQLVRSLSEFMSKDDILKMLRSKSIKQAGNLSDKEIFGILDGRFIAPKFDTKFFKELQRDFPEMEKRTPYIATKFADLFDLYNDRSLLTELPEINIKGD